MGQIGGAPFRGTVGSHTANRSTAEATAYDDDCGSLLSSQELVDENLRCVHRVHGVDIEDGLNLVIWHFVKSANLADTGVQE